MRGGCWYGACAILLLVPGPAAAQQSRPSLLAIDTVASIDEAVDANGNYATGLFLDAVVSVKAGRGVEAIAWPIVQRLSNGQWMRDLWIAALRYERPGPVGIRLEGGLIPAPVGLANLAVRRPHLNPTIAAPASLFTPLPPLEIRGPRPNLLGGVYPFGGQATVSGARWDARVALIDT